MAEDRTPPDLMGYHQMAQEALRGVVRQALARAASAQGLPGDHHFYISFQTRAPGVQVPTELSDRYPEEMTIVLQHQFWELSPGDAAFSVVLRFGGQPKKLTVPYAAVTRFHDPAVPFALQFDAPTPPRSEPRKLPPPPASAASEDGGPPDPEGPKIVSLDQFRKK